MQVPYNKETVEQIGGFKATLKDQATKKVGKTPKNSADATQEAANHSTTDNSDTTDASATGDASAAAADGTSTSSEAHDEGIKEHFEWCPSPVKRFSHWIMNLDCCPDAVKTKTTVLINWFIHERKRYTVVDASWIH